MPGAGRSSRPSATGSTPNCRSHRSAVICSLIETCKLNGVEPYAYLADVLTRMVDGHPVNWLDDLLPWAWNADHPVNP